MYTRVQARTLGTERVKRKDGHPRRVGNEFFCGSDSFTVVSNKYKKQELVVTTDPTIIRSSYDDVLGITSVCRGGFSDYIGCFSASTPSH